MQDNVERVTIHLLSDGESVQIKVTDEGLIIDCVDKGGEVVGTFCNTFDEIYEWLVPAELLDGPLTDEEVARYLENLDPSDASEAQARADVERLFKRVQQHDK